MSSRNYALKGEQRKQAGKGVARALRRENKIPGVIYGDRKEAVSISLPIKEVTLEYLKGHMFTSLCSLSLDGKDNLVLARDIQLHPVSDNVMHIDFLRVTPKTKLAIHVPLKFINEAECPGLTEESGILNIVAHDLELVCVATEIPDHIDIDLTGLKLHDVIHLSALKLPAGATPVIKDPEYTVATIMEPRRIVEEVAAPAEGAEGAEGAAPAEGAEGAAAAPAEGAAPAEKQGGKGKKE